MAGTGDVIEQPVIGERVAVRRTAAEANGVYLQLGFAVRPGAGATHLLRDHACRERGPLMFSRLAKIGALAVIYLAVQLAALYLVVGAVAGGLFAYP